ncbi:flavodoxin [Methanosarcina acetivorans]|uniref:Flavodoxin n=1 Tax=Methanosarcina acetivorans (strain ATCC 35395 / DSM 2834 / JCM 12185 / C2A) TaxID=188937 RepID=Q8TMF9_METAC|nr:flavodoxin [Methanosarcina acetivorans]AAM06078.1 flavodoxin [Methanosarcina acetivorans C2A]
MEKTIIVYGSSTGNTEILAEEIKGTLEKYDGKVKLMEVTDLHPTDLANYDTILLGCSTWGDGELQDDFIPFEEEMEGVDLKGKKAACFGPGDSTFPLFCNAVDLLEEKLKSCGAQIIVEGLKIDGDVDYQLDKAEEWANEVAQAVSV